MQSAFVGCAENFSTDLSEPLLIRQIFTGNLEKVFKIFKLFENSNQLWIGQLFIFKPFK